MVSQAAVASVIERVLWAQDISEWTQPSLRPVLVTLRRVLKKELPERGCGEGSKTI